MNLAPDNTLQKLNVNLEIAIPADQVLINKIELEELREQTLTGVYWSMKDLEERINKKQVWIKENILFVPTFKEKLDSENGGFVYYPKKQGETWSFQATRMAEFLEKNFYRIFS